MGRPRAAVVREVQTLLQPQLAVECALNERIALSRHGVLARPVAVVPPRARLADVGGHGWRVDAALEVAGGAARTRGVLCAGPRAVSGTTGALRTLRACRTDALLSVLGAGRSDEVFRNAGAVSVLARA
jgi:hypothetical protein